MSYNLKIGPVDILPQHHVDMWSVVPVKSRVVSIAIQGDKSPELVVYDVCFGKRSIRVSPEETFEAESFVGGLSRHSFKRLDILAGEIINISVKNLETKTLTLTFSVTLTEIGAIAEDHSSLTKFEYLLVPLFRETQEKLNELGLEGWELICVVEKNKAIFKRPLPK